MECDKSSYANVVFYQIGTNMLDISHATPGVVEGSTSFPRSPRIRQSLFGVCLARGVHENLIASRDDFSGVFTPSCTLMHEPLQDVRSGSSLHGNTSSPVRRKWTRCSHFQPGHYASSPESGSHFGVLREEYRRFGFDWEMASGVSRSREGAKAHATYSELTLRSSKWWCLCVFRLFSIMRLTESLEFLPLEIFMALQSPSTAEHCTCAFSVEDIATV